MSTELEICNSALIKLGVEPLDDLLGDDKATRLWIATYTMIRDELLSSHYWNFAMKRAVLVDSGVTPEYGFTYAYTIPADNLRIHSLHENTTFKVEGDKILTDLSSAEVLYISQETDTANFTALFTEALSTRMSSNLAYPMVQSVSLSEKLHAKSDKKLRDARSFDGQEGTMDSLQDDYWLDSRLSGPFGQEDFFGKVVI